MKIGILALQGAFREHKNILEKLGVEVSLVRLPEDIQEIDGLIIPGGESTVIGKLAVDMGLLEGLREFAREKPVWGTCAGAIFLSNDPRLKKEQPLLETMDIEVERNAFGRQVDSFETVLDVNLDGKIYKFEAVFIRAPIIKKVGEGVSVLAKIDDGKIVAARQNHLLATSFHPELTDDYLFHKYFIDLVEKNKK